VFWPTKSQQHVPPGRHTPWTGGTRAQRWTRTDAIEFGFGKPVTYACMCDAVTWFPTKVAIPQSSSTDMILTSLRDARRRDINAHALENPEPRSPLISQSNSHTSALEQLITTISNIVEPTPEPTPVNPPAPT
jgi:hypothetical protein